MLDPNKLQGDTPPTADDLGPDVIISPDSERAQRLPPNQVRTKKWPVLDAHGPPDIDTNGWEFTISGLVDSTISLTREEFAELPRVKVFADMHCVTRWSRLGNLWEGVSTRELVRRAQIRPEARYVVIHAFDHEWTTNLPLDAFLADDALFADTHDGEPISLGHGGPVRLVVPQLYAWKSAKWVSDIKLVEADEAGFWERGGYHMLGDPWKEQRYRIG